MKFTQRCIHKPESNYSNYQINFGIKNFPQLIFFFFWLLGKSLLIIHANYIDQQTPRIQEFEISQKRQSREITVTNGQMGGRNPGYNWLPPLWKEDFFISALLNYPPPPYLGTTDQNLSIVWHFIPNLWKLILTEILSRQHPRKLMQQRLSGQKFMNLWNFIVAKIHHNEVLW